MPNYTARFYGAPGLHGAPLILEWAPFYALSLDDAEAVARRAAQRSRGGTLSRAEGIEVAESGERVA